MPDQAKAGAIVYAMNVARVSAFYAEIIGLKVSHAEDDHVVLESPNFQLVVVAIPESIAATIELTSPPARRTETPIKLVFPVASLGAARTAAARLGGELNPAAREWQFHEYRVCDGHDPEGNVVQFRERAL
jgi:predicted enzyme related to lactoylglutathione lyase